MLVQSVARGRWRPAGQFHYRVAVALLGIGTAMVYLTLSQQSRTSPNRATAPHLGVTASARLLVRHRALAAGILTDPASADAAIASLPSSPLQAVSS